MFKRVSSRLNCSWTTNRDVEDSGETKRWWAARGWRSNVDDTVKLEIDYHQTSCKNFRKFLDTHTWDWLGLGFATCLQDIQIYWSFSPTHGDTLGSDQQSLARRPTANAISKGGPTSSQVQKTIRNESQDNSSASSLQGALERGCQERRVLISTLSSGSASDSKGVFTMRNSSREILSASHRRRKPVQPVSSKLELRFFISVKDQN